MHANSDGLFYDPADLCAPGSDDINRFDCEYNCDWNDVSSGYSCAPGDLSGKFEGLYIGDGDLLFSFLFSNHDALLIQLNQMTDKFVALGCSNSNKIIARAQFEKMCKVTTCAPRSKTDTTSGSSDKHVSSSKGKLTTQYGTWSGTASSGKKTESGSDNTRGNTAILEEQLFGSPKTHDKIEHLWNKSIQ